MHITEAYVTTTTPKGFGAKALAEELKGVLRHPSSPRRGGQLARVEARGARRTRLSFAVERHISVRFGPQGRGRAPRRRLARRGAHFPGAGGELGAEDDRYRRAALTRGVSRISLTAPVCLRENLCRRVRVIVSSIQGHRAGTLQIIDVRRGPVR